VEFHSLGVQPSYALGVQPSCALGLQPSCALAVQPPYTLGVQPFMLSSFSHLTLKNSSCFNGVFLLILLNHRGGKFTLAHNK